MPYEIDMLSVGAADAILIRYFGPDDKEIVVLIDAGRRKHGKKVVRHIKKWTVKKAIDLAICTHSDADHIGGFFEVVDRIPIAEFWIHDPSKYAFDVQPLLERLHGNAALLQEFGPLNESLSDATNLIQEIDAKGILRRSNLFGGLEYKRAPLKVVGPTESSYSNLLQKFRDFGRYVSQRTSTSISERILAEAKMSDALARYNDYSKENNSSAIIYFTPGKSRFLFTADTKSEYILEAKKKYGIADLTWMQIPHHGSKYNINEAVIDALKPRTVYISGDGSVDYPHASVVAMLKAKKCKVFSTVGRNLLYRSGTPKRDSYSKAQEL